MNAVSWMTYANKPSSGFRLSWVDKKHDTSVHF